jgi:hypothetical protein
MVPRAWVGPQWEKPFLHVYFGKKNLSSRTSRPISINLGTNHPQVRKFKIIQIYQGPGHLQRGDNHKNRVGSFKNLFINNQ